jgi:hypothetical protein
MGRKSISGGVTALGTSRIRFDFVFERVRYRPSLSIVPTEANLRRARARLQAIKERVAQRTFSFAGEFPDYRFLSKTPRGGPPRTCNNVFDAFLAHCEARHDKHDMAAITVACYRRVIENFWRPRIGTARFLDVRYFDTRCAG